ncbi:hypothetical protein LJC71_04825 [Desulfosarcina sp. OttesenSCG-928-A07]|nr:hypothetical protein [Desulfosarcina sp. OttesenSCG-928-G17]MDL2329061.1 hypothetical protein [Desulfosarcina sp. OttesenSCG-928-A07]
MSERKINENCEHYFHSLTMGPMCSISDATCGDRVDWCPLYVETKAVCPICLFNSSEQAPLYVKDGVYYCIHPICPVKTFTSLELAEALSETAVDFFLWADGTEKKDGVVS